MLMSMQSTNIVNYLLKALIICAVCVHAFHHPHSPTTSLVERQRSNLFTKPMQSQDEQPETKQRVGARVAFLGNSILYYNDCPRFLVNLGKGSSSDGSGSAHYRVEYQDSCLRGGTNLAQLWYRGNGMMSHGFTSDAAAKGKEIGDVGSPTVQDLLGGPSTGGGNGDNNKWDYIVFNDHTQGPARLDSRKATQETLLEYYLPLILENEATVIIVETAAYRLSGINNSKDLGSAQEFQSLVREGVQSYVETLQTKLPKLFPKPKVAPVGTAYLRVHDNNHALWETLFDPYDNFHPSPSGTFLQGCVLHCTMFGSPPPLPSTEKEIVYLWRDARVMHNVKHGENRRMPSVEEAEYLWNVANDICSETLS
mmetsp:Transcript_39171/g.81940  ORF Transcript_39171/g.81940 Transcript_39171/m.81940 type:complete len:367 (-) Transcript_39171:104-1204(-)